MKKSLITIYALLLFSTAFADDLSGYRGGWLNLGLGDRIP